MSENIAPDFSPDQREALRKVEDWLAGDAPKFFSLMGPAGTGKTTLAKHLAANVKGTVRFAAFTGKAAQVMQRAGCLGASTIHSLIYSPSEKSQARLCELELAIDSFPEDGDPEELRELHAQLDIEKENLKRPHFKLRSDSDLRYASLCVIDECSMVDEQIGSDLLSFGVPILALGDPGQLPPVRGTGYFIKDQPDHLLTEIHRQALESPIIQMATTVRMGGHLTAREYGQECRVIDGKPSPEDVLAADQVIVGRNRTRHKVNQRIRELLGREGDPVVGDKIVCLRNNHDLGLLNGSLWEIQEVCMFEDICELVVRPFGQEGDPVRTIAHTHYFQGRGEDLSYFDKRDADEFDFGYAITCHKAQGSQWGNVMIFDESSAFRGDASRWLYTAITRAIEKVTVVDA